MRWTKLICRSQIATCKFSKVFFITKRVAIKNADRQRTNIHKHLFCNVANTFPSFSLLICRQALIIHNGEWNAKTSSNTKKNEATETVWRRKETVAI